MCLVCCCWTIYNCLGLSCKGKQRMSQLEKNKRERGRRRGEGGSIKSNNRPDKHSRHRQRQRGRQRQRQRAERQRERAERQRETKAGVRERKSGVREVSFSLQPATTPSHSHSLHLVPTNNTYEAKEEEQGVGGVGDQSNNNNNNNNKKKRQTTKTDHITQADENSPYHAQDDVSYENSPTISTENRPSQNPCFLPAKAGQRKFVLCLSVCCVCADKPPANHTQRGTRRGCLAVLC